MSDFLLESALQCYVMWWRTYEATFVQLKTKITTNRRHFTFLIMTFSHWPWPPQITLTDHDFYPQYFRQNIFVLWRDMYGGWGMPFKKFQANFKKFQTEIKICFHEIEIKICFHNEIEMFFWNENSFSLLAYVCHSIPWCHAPKLTNLGCV